MSRGRNTAILAGLAAALAAYIFFIERHREVAPAGAPDTPRSKVFAQVDATKIEEVQKNLSPVYFLEIGGGY